MTFIDARGTGNRRYLRVSGHATGCQDACTAVSTLVCTLDAYLQEVRLKEHVQFHNHRIASGDVLLEFSGGPGAMTAFELTALGLFQLAAKFPGFICANISI